MGNKGARRHMLKHRPTAWIGLMGAVYPLVHCFHCQVQTEYNFMFGTIPAEVKDRRCHHQCSCAPATSRAEGSGQQRPIHLALLLARDGSQMVSRRPLGSTGAGGA